MDFSFFLLILAFIPPPLPLSPPSSFWQICVTKMSTRSCQGTDSVIKPLDTIPEDKKVRVQRTQSGFDPFEKPTSQVKRVHSENNACINAKSSSTGKESPKLRRHSSPSSVSTLSLCCSVTDISNCQSPSRDYGVVCCKKVSGFNMIMLVKSVFIAPDCPVLASPGAGCTFRIVAQTY